MLFLKFRLYFLTPIMLAFSLSKISPNRLVVRIHPPPKKAFDLAKQDFISSSKNTTNNKIPENLKRRPTTGGIQVRYAGYRRYTSRDGLAIFPLSHTGKKITLVIAPEIFPRILSGNTVDHFALWNEKKPENLDVKIFEMIRSKVNQEEWEWDIKQKQDLPDDGKIPNTAVIIQADPDSVYVPEGKVKAKSKQHSILPVIYLLDRDGIDEMILKSLGKFKLDERNRPRYNFFQNLKEKIKIEEANEKKMKITNLPEQVLEKD